MDDFHSFDELTTSLNFKDTFRLCQSNKNFNRFCTNEYWQRKAMKNYNYDLAHAVGNNNTQKYKWVEDNIESPIYKRNTKTGFVKSDTINNITDDYFWSKKIEYEFGLFDLLEGNESTGKDIYSFVYRLSIGDYDINDLPLWLRDVPKLFEYVSKYGINRLFRKRRIEFTNGLQLYSKQIFVNRRNIEYWNGKDQLRIINIFDIWYEKEHYDYIYDFIDSFYEDTKWWRKKLLLLVTQSLALSLDNQNVNMEKIQDVYSIFYISLDKLMEYDEHSPWMLDEEEFIFTAEQLELELMQYSVSELMNPIFQWLKLQ